MSGRGSSFALAKGRWMAFNLSIDTLLKLPFWRRVKYLSVSYTTLNGPNYTFVKEDWVASLQMKTYSACCSVGSTYEDESATRFGRTGLTENIK